MGLDAYALKSSTVQIAGAFSYAGDDKNELKAVNLLMRIDDEAMQPSASASNGRPTSSNVAGLSLIHIFRCINSTNGIL